MGVLYEMVQPLLQELNLHSVISLLFDIYLQYPPNGTEEESHELGGGKKKQDEWICQRSEPIMKDKRAGFKPPPAVCNR
jgi:hypothetical protein